MGGYRDVGVYLDSVEYLHPEDGSWQTAAATLPTPADGLRATNIDDRILIFGIFGSKRSSRSQNICLSVRPCQSVLENFIFIYLAQSHTSQSLKYFVLFYPPEKIRDKVQGA